MSITPLRVGSRGESERRSASFSERALSQLIRVLGASSSRSDLAERLASSGEAGGGLRAAFSNFAAGDRIALSAALGSSLLNEVISLSRENDAELLGEGLLSLAGRLERNGQEGRAELVYETVLGLNPPLPPLFQRRGIQENSSSLPPPFEKGGPGGISRRAQERLAALHGGGSFGDRFEIHARHFLRDASDPSMIAGMGAAGLVSSALRLGVLSRLSAQPSTWLTRGFGARFTAGAVSLAFEAPAFTAAVHGAHSLLGRPQDLSLGGLGHELASGYLLIGALRLSGGATRSFAERYIGAGSATASQRLGLGLLEQSGAFAAILASHRAEQSLGLRPAATGEAMAFDALASLVQFRVGSHFAERFLGSGYRNAMREMQLRSAAAETLPRPRASTGHFGMDPALAALGPMTGPAEIFEPVLPTILQMSTRPPKSILSVTTRPPRAPRSATEDSRQASRSSQVSTLPSAAETLAELRALAPKAQVRRLRDIYQSGHLAPLALEAEFQAQPSGLKVTDFAAARHRLQILEGEFEQFFASESGRIPAERHWESFQQWQNELYPKDPSGLGRVQQIARAMGLPNLFVFKAEGSNLKARVRRDQETADFYHDLSLVRNFLRGKGLNRAEVLSDDGKLLSNLLLKGDGNCVTLSLLFAHFAARIGHPLEIGLLPRHTFLVGRRGGAIDSILDFGMVLSKPYLARTIGPESKALPAQHLFTLHLMNLGKLGVDRGAFGPAETALGLARDLLPLNPRSYLQLGRLHQHRGELAQAFDNYSRVHALHPNDMHRYNSLRVQAWESIAAGTYREAEASLRQMNDLQPADLDVLRALRLVYERSNRPNSAAEMQSLLEVMEMDTGGD